MCHVKSVVVFVSVLSVCALLFCRSAFLVVAKVHVMLRSYDGTLLHMFLLLLMFAGVQLYVSTFQKQRMMEVQVRFQWNMFGSF